MLAPSIPKKNNMDNWLVEPYRGNHGVYFSLESTSWQQKLQEGCRNNPDFDLAAS